MYTPYTLAFLPLTHSLINTFTQSSALTHSHTNLIRSLSHQLSITVCLSRCLALHYYVQFYILFLHHHFKQKENEILIRIQNDYDVITPVVVCMWCKPRAVWRLASRNIDKRTFISIRLANNCELWTHFHYFEVYSSRTLSLCLALSLSLALSRKFQFKWVRGRCVFARARVYFVHVSISIFSLSLY